MSAEQRQLFIFALLSSCVLRMLTQFFFFLSLPVLEANGKLGPLLSSSVIEMPARSQWRRAQSVSGVATSQESYEVLLWLGVKGNLGSNQK